MTLRVATILAVACALFSPHDVAAQDKPVRVLVSNGMKAAMLDLRPQLEQAAGRKLDLQFSSTAGLKKRIEDGEVFDAAVITSEAVRGLIQDSKLAGGSQVEVGYSKLGVGARTGLRKPDIETAEALKGTLLSAKSITYPIDGASRTYLEKTFQEMGIAPQMKAKVLLAEGSAASTASVAQGKSELVITLFSEIVPVHGLTVLGPLPGALNYEISFAVGTSAQSKSGEAVKMMATFLASSKSDPILRESGIERRR